ncbi:hypothetical protein Tco_1385346 [Tanacetum coccineum]
MGCAEVIEEMLEIKVYEMGGDEDIFTSEAWRRAVDIREPVYAELCYEFYATYKFDTTVTDEDLMSRKVIKFRNDDHFNVNQYWSEISSENALILSRSYARTIRKPILRFITKIARRVNLLTDKVLNGLSAPIYCSSLDTTTLRELIDSNRRLIAEEPTLGDLRVADAIPFMIYTTG